MDSSRAAVLSLTGLQKAFGSAVILKHLDLDAFDGEFLSLLGPSGCGKTTTLRIVAGFEQPDRGQVVLGGKRITALPPNKRDVSTVFQDYSLFPHMTVAENVAFGLVERRMPKPAIAARVAEMLDLARLGGFSERRPGQLSGGQKQRVALARSLAVRPRVLLLDEPLGALDLKLRKEMQLELRSFQRRLGITFIYVTHDQEEALTMSDRIVVMKAGEIQQIGDARAIYDRPTNRFVADFIGETTFIPVEITAIDRQRNVAEATALGRRFEAALSAGEGLAVGNAHVLSLRPEKVTIGATADQNALDAEVETVVFRGSVQEFILRLADGSTLRATAPATAAAMEPGARVTASWKPTDAVLLRG